MKYIIEATRGESTGNNSIPWYLIIYDDETGKIEELTEYQYKEEELSK